MTDIEGPSRHDNVRIHGVKEGAEENMTSVITLVEDLLLKGQEVPPSAALIIKRAHWALASNPPMDAPPRSIKFKNDIHIVIAFFSYLLQCSE